MDERFLHPKYVIRRKVFKLMGAAFHIYDESERQVLLYSKQKAFKLKEDIRLYTGEDQQAEVLLIQARSIIDWGAAYDVFDSQSGEKIGGLRRKGWKSIVRDEWILMDPGDAELGQITERNQLLALARRFVDFVAFFFPQRYDVTLGGQPVASFQQNMNPFVQKIVADFSQDPDSRLDPRLGIAAAVLICAIEGRQE